MNYPLHIIENSNILQRALRYVFDNNSANYLPYHNLNHIMQMMKYAHMLIHKGPSISDYNKLLLLTAAIFHDFNYDPTLETDALRIQAAKRGLATFIHKNNMSELIEESRVCKLIDATEYPYVIPVDELTYGQMILRDADFMMIFEPNFTHQIIFGLAKELNISIEEMVNKQRSFLENITFNTEYGREYRNMHWEYLTHEFELLEQMYKL